MFISKLTKVCFLIAILALIITPAVLVQAQEAETTNLLPLDEIDIDETVTAEELGVKEPTLLPDSSFYFLKSWRRGLRSIFTRDPAKKAELKLKYASEKLLEARKLSDKKKKPEILIKAAENFREEMERVKAQVDKIGETASNSPKVASFLDKFIQKQVLYQKILDKLEENVPEGVFEKIRAIKEIQLVRFGEVMEKLEDKEQIKTRIEKNLKQLKGSAFKNVKEMEILKRFEEKAPEAIKEKIMEARELRLEDFKVKMEKMKPEVREKFDVYIEKMKGSGVAKMEILEDIKNKIQFRPDIKEKLESAQTRVINMLQKDSENKGLSCRTIAIVPRDCKGKVIIERNEDGCPIPRCITVTEVPSASLPSTGIARPGEEPTKRSAYCIELWSPVCGVNGRTYGNDCKARVAGVEIEHKGACKSASPTTGTTIQPRQILPKRIRIAAEEQPSSTSTVNPAGNSTTEYNPDDCPQLVSPAPGSCAGGKWITQKRANGCPIFVCEKSPTTGTTQSPALSVEPTEPLYDPDTFQQKPAPIGIAVDVQPSQTSTATSEELPTSEKPTDASEPTTLGGTDSNSTQ